MSDDVQRALLIQRLLECTRAAWRLPPAALVEDGA